MTGIGWTIADALAYLLRPAEREAVLGDLTEANESAGEALRTVAGLVARRSLPTRANWQEWLTAFALALPCTVFLIGFSVSLSRTYQDLLSPAILRITGLAVGTGFWVLASNILLLVGCRFAAQSVSRRILWASAALSAIPCLFCLASLRLESISRFCLVISLPLAAWGAYRVAKLARIRLSAALVLAVVITLLTVPTWHSAGPWIPNWALSWPAWYLVVAAWLGNATQPGESNAGA